MAWRRYVIGGAGDDAPTALIWNGSRLGIGVGTTSVGGARRDVALHVLSDVGASFGSATPTAGTGDGGAVAWAADRFALVWSDARTGDRDVFAAAYDADAVAIVRALAVEAVPGAGTSPSLTWSGSELALAWSDRRTGDDEIYFARMTTAGAVVGATTRLTTSAGASIEPVVISNGFGFGVLWIDDRDGGGSEVYFASLDASGTRIGADSRITAAAGVARGLSGVWSGAHYLVAWADARGGSFRVFATRVGADGVEIGDDVAVSTAGIAGTTTMALATAAELGLAWNDDSTGRNEIHLVRIGACP